MQLPLLLAGPILRRVETTLVSVFVALSESADVRITLWDGRVTAGSGNPWFSSAPAGATTVRVGAKLHVVVATSRSRRPRRASSNPAASIATTASSSPPTARTR